jgi:hypothetical protein
MRCLFKLVFCWIFLWAHFRHTTFRWFSTSSDIIYYFHIIGVSSNVMKAYDVVDALLGPTFSTNTKREGENTGEGQERF